MADQTDCKIAEAAQELIRDPEHFCQEAYARNVLGGSVSVRSNEAIKFCAVGALMRVCFADGPGYSAKVDAALYQAAREYGERHALHPGERNPATINDKYGHKAIMAVYDRVREIVC